MVTGVEGFFVYIYGVHFILRVCFRLIFLSNARLCEKYKNYINLSYTSTFFSRNCVYSKKHKK